MSAIDTFPPTLAEANARLAAVRPFDYGRTRNALDGAITRLSPYITHGFVDLPSVAAAVGAPADSTLTARHGLHFQLGWREFFRQVWQHQGDAIFSSIHPGPLPDDAYVRELPADVREARTGVPVIDVAVRTLYADGYLHNHARLWLASYLVHLRRVHWRSGADWMYTHLLDGDLASNHLSWQWVAGTFAQKPYLFNADNVARFAPARWHSDGSAIDISYEALDEIARGGVLPAVRPHGDGLPEPQARRKPPRPLGAVPASADAVAGRDVWLVHPWALGDPPDDLPAATLRISICTEEFHRKWPWDDARWSFVGARMAHLSALRWHDSAAAIASALRHARTVRGLDDAHVDAEIRRAVDWDPPRRIFGAVDQPCNSFSRWWKLAQVTEQRSP